MSTLPDLPRFEALWARTVADGRAAEAWRVLDAGYGDPARAYHDWHHIGAMLRDLDAVRADPAFGSVAFDEIELAIFFHDAVYDPRASDNEARSATLFERCAGLAPRIGEDAAKRVTAFIISTAAHAPTEDLATQLLCDLDLAVLGAPFERYEVYAAAVRQEHAHVPDALWRGGRRAVLDRFLARQGIYQTLSFAQRLEAQTRVNLDAERKRLMTTSSGP